MAYPLDEDDEVERVICHEFARGDVYECVVMNVLANGAGLKTTLSQSCYLPIDELNKKA